MGWVKLPCSHAEPTSAWYRLFSDSWAIQARVWGAASCVRFGVTAGTKAEPSTSSASTAVPGVDGDALRAVARDRFQVAIADVERR
jgi:hypothetical protein